MLGNRHQFDVGVTHFEHVGQQRLGKFEITELPVSFFEFASPRAEMNFVNADRDFAASSFSRRDSIHSCVAPFVALEIVNERRGDVAVLIEERERIALEQKRAGLGANLEFVVRAFA